MNKRKVIYDGKGFESLKELAEQYGLSPKLLTGRLSEGWTLEKAIEIELGEVITNATPVTYQNVTYKSIKQMADTLNLPYWSLAYYLSKIKDIDNAVEQCRLNNSKTPLILWGNQYDSLVEISMAFGVRYSSLVKELGDNKSLQEAVQNLLSVEPIEFEGRQYATISELCMDYRIQPVNVYKRLKQGMQLDQALKQPLRITSRGDRIAYEGVVYQSKTALCREYGISVMCVNQNARLNKSSFIETFQLLHQLKEHAGMTKADQLNFIPHCIIRGTLYKTNNVLANELGISPELIKAYKRHHGFTNLFDSLKAMQTEKKAVCQLSTEVTTWEELKRRGYTKSQIDGLKLSHQILVPMYPQLQGKDFDTDCIDTLELYDQLRERLQPQLDEQDVERIAKEAEDVETEYIPDRLWDAQESQDQKGQIIISDCIAGLTQCAAELARDDPGGSADKVLRLRQHVAAIIDHLGMKETYLGTFDEKIKAAKQGDELPATTVKQQLAAVHELYHYGMEMVTAQGRALKNSIKEIRDLMMEAAQHWNVLSPELVEMNNALTKELVLMEIPENRSIIFSHIVLRGDNGVEASDFVSGPIYDSECVENTDTYQEFIADHPDVKNTEVCVNSYKIGTGESVYLPKEALELIQSAGEDFLNYKGMELYDWNLISVHNYECYPKMGL